MKMKLKDYSDAKVQASLTDEVLLNATLKGVTVDVWHSDDRGLYDVQTDLDAQRVARYGAPVVQIVTNGGCHLEAKLVQDALDRLDLSSTDLLVIENVGNLVCPANYDLGEAMKVVLLSTTEGDDKPLKYPAMFRNASVLVVNKVDLVPYVNCRLETLIGHARSINPAASPSGSSSRTLRRCSGVNC